MKKIELTQGQFAIVDDEDYEYLSQWKWYASKNWKNKYYARTGIGSRKNNKKIYMHRLVIKCADGLEVDHINGNGLDNRKENLRSCTRQENTRNARTGKENSLGYKGVRKEGKFYCACVSDGKKVYTSDYFLTPKEAAYAYDKKARELFGEFSKLNFPEGEK